MFTAAGAWSKKDNVWFILCSVRLTIISCRSWTISNIDLHGEDGPVVVWGSQVTSISLFAFCAWDRISASIVPIVRTIISCLYCAMRLYRDAANKVRLSWWKPGAIRIFSMLSADWSSQSYESGSQLVCSRCFNIATFSLAFCSAAMACQIRYAERTWKT